MNWIEVAKSIREAEETLKAADDNATQMARILKGRLRKVWNSETLASLKKELSQFNAHTGKWKEDA